MVDPGVYGGPVEAAPVAFDLDEHERPAALGAVVEEGRGSLPYALIHGESLVACAAWALGDAGVRAVDLGTAWADVVSAAEPFVLHDPLCPMTPASFIAECVARAVEHGRVVVAVRTDQPVGQAAVVSPVVLPAGVVAALEAIPSLDFATMAAALAQRFEVEVVPAPAAARRVGSVDEIRALETATRASPVWQ